MVFTSLLGCVLVGKVRPTRRLARCEPQVFPEAPINIQFKVDDDDDGCDEGARRTGEVFCLGRRLRSGLPEPVVPAFASGQSHVGRWYCRPRSNWSWERTGNNKNVLVVVQQQQQSNSTRRKIRNEQRSAAKRNEYVNDEWWCEIKICEIRWWIDETTHGALDGTWTRLSLSHRHCRFGLVLRVNDDDGFYFVCKEDMAIVKTPLTLITNE